MAIQRGEGNLVKVDKADVTCAGTGEGGGAVGADATDADDYDACLAQGGEAGFG